MKKGLILALLFLVVGLGLWRDNRMKIGTTVYMPAKSYIAGGLIGLAVVVIFITYNS